MPFVSNLTRPYFPSLIVQEMFGQLHILIFLPLTLLLMIYCTKSSFQAVFISKVVQSNHFQLGPNSVGAFWIFHMNTRTYLVSETFCINR